MKMHKLVFFYDYADYQAGLAEFELPENFDLSTESLTQHFRFLFSKQIQEYYETWNNAENIHNEQLANLAKNNLAQKLFPEETIFPYYSHGQLSGGWCSEKNGKLIPFVPIIEVYTLEDWFEKRKIKYE